MIQTCQMSGRIRCKITSSKSLETQPAKMLEMVSHFDRELQQWRDSLPPSFRPETRLRDLKASPFPRSIRLAFIHGLYYNSLMAIHTLFAYPWITDITTSLSLTSTLRTKIEAQIKQSSEAMVTAARNIIVMTRNFDINGACTDGYDDSIIRIWAFQDMQASANGSLISSRFMLHYPMHAFINLFIYVIRYPTLPTVRSDLALLDVAAGYFGQMEFITGSKLSFPFARDITALARQVVVSQETRRPPNTKNIQRPTGSFSARRRVSGDVCSV